MLNRIVDLDKELFLYLNSRHTEWLDPFMLLLSSYTLWTVVFILFGALIFIFSKKAKWYCISFYAVSVLLSSLFTNGVKLLVQRPRPIHEKAWEGTIHNIEKYSEAFSFFSSHAATTFCIAVFVLFFFNKHRYIGYIAVVWAVGVSYSRIYLSKHYPLDVLVGLITGCIIGYAGYWLLTRFLSKKGLTL